MAPMRNHKAADVDFIILFAGPGRKIIDLIPESKLPL